MANNPTTYRLDEETKRLLGLVAEKDGITQVDEIALMVRQRARQYGLLPALVKSEPEPIVKAAQPGEKWVKGSNQIPYEPPTPSTVKTPPWEKTALKKEGAGVALKPKNGKKAETAVE